MSSGSKIMVSRVDIRVQPPVVIPGSGGGDEKDSPINIRRIWWSWRLERESNMNESREARSDREQVAKVAKATIVNNDII